MRLHHSVLSGKPLNGNRLIFQHNDDPKHAANAVKAYLDRKRHTVERYQSGNGLSRTRFQHLKSQHPKKSFGIPLGNYS